MSETPEREIENEAVRVREREKEKEKERTIWPRGDRDEASGECTCSTPVIPHKEKRRRSGKSSSQESLA